MQTYFSIDGARAILVVLLAIGQVIMAYWPQFRKWPETTPSQSAKLRNPVVPIEWAFSIWGLIFASSLAFAVWQALPENLGDPLAREIGWLAAMVFACNIVWEAWVPKRSLDVVSLLIIWIELAILLVIWWIVAPDRPEGVRYWLVSAPFQIFAGWVSAAVFVNTASTLQRAGVTVSTTLSAVLLLLAGALGAAVSVTTGGWIYAVTVGWALFGIVMANTVRDKNVPITVLAAVLVPAVLVAPWLQGRI